MDFWLGLLILFWLSIEFFEPSNIITLVRLGYEGIRVRISTGFVV